MDKYKVTVGAKAYSFHDQSTGITICRGEEKELSARQYRTKKIQMALNSGHLRLVLDKKAVDKYSNDDIDKLEKKLKAQFEKVWKSKRLPKPILSKKQPLSLLVTKLLPTKVIQLKL